MLSPTSCPKQYSSLSNIVSRAFVCTKSGIAWRFPISVPAIALGLYQYLHTHAHGDLRSLI